MPNLLVVGLTETSYEDEYEVIAWNLDSNQWIVLKQLRYEDFTVDNKVIWDLFQITEANLVEYYHPSYGRRQEDYRVIDKTKCKVKGRYNKEQIQGFLKNISVNTASEIEGCIGVVKISTILEIAFNIKDKYTYLPNKKSDPFFWESRIQCIDMENTLNDMAKNKNGAACKDLRWKHYWLNMYDDFERKSNRWKNIMNGRETYLLIEYYLNVRYHVIAGVHCI